MIVPALIPGLGERLIGSNGSGQGTGPARGDTITVINPILDLRRDLVSASNAVVLRYTTTASVPAAAADRHRLTVFDGTDLVARAPAQVPATSGSRTACRPRPG